MGKQTLKLTCVSVSSGPSTSMMGVAWSLLITWMAAPPDPSMFSTRFRPSLPSVGFRALARVSKALVRGPHTSHGHCDAHYATSMQHKGGLGRSHPLPHSKGLSLLPSEWIFRGFQKDQGQPYLLTINWHCLM